MLKQALFGFAALALAWPVAAEPITTPAQRERTIATVKKGQRFCRACDLFQADFAYADLRGRDFAGARLRQADLQAAELDNVRFTGADLTIVNAFAARFSGANFTGANLFRGNFVGAHFEGAILAGANLGEAIFSGADLSAARGLTQSQISNACGDETTLLPLGMTIPAC